MMLQALAAAVATSLLAAAPQNPVQQLPTSNGFASLAWDVQEGALRSFREHLFEAKDRQVPVLQLGDAAFFGVRLGGKATSLRRAETVRARYAPATGIVEVDQRGDGFEATTYLFAPFAVPAASAALVFKIRNTGKAPLAAGDAVFAFLDFHLGEGPKGDGREQIDWDPSRELLIERSLAGRVMTYLPLAADSRHAMKPDDPFKAFEKGSDLAGTGSSGVVDDAVGAFQWSLEGLAPGEVKWVGVAIGYHPHGQDGVAGAFIRRWAVKHKPDELLELEHLNWDKWHLKTLEPPDISDEERTVFKQQMALLRMAQVREPNDAVADYLPHGQIVPNLGSGARTATEVRDACLAIQALAPTGHAAEAREALAFFLSGKAGTFVCCDRQKAPYVGGPYQISTARYYGRGHEDAEVSPEGPEISWDGFGMFLSALDAYERASGDTALAEKHWAAVTDGVAEVLVKLVEKDGLLRPDASLGGGRWETAGRRRWLWTQVQAAAGLQAAATLAQRHGKTDLVPRYLGAARSLREAIAAQFVDGSNLLRASLGEGAPQEDPTVAVAFSQGVLPAAGPAARATLEKLHASLRLPSGGYRREPGAGAREWVFGDLLMATALRRAGLSEAADEALKRVTTAARTHLYLPEAFDAATGAPAGAMPMIGLGAAAYVNALLERAENAPALIGEKVDPAAVKPAASATATAAPDAGAAREPAVKKTRCGCSDGGTASLLSMVPLAALVLQRRRRQS